MTTNNMTAAPLAATAISTPVALAADNRVAQKFAADRLAYFGAGNAEAILAQYAEDATVITQMGVLHSRDEIKGMIDGIIAEFARPGVTFNLLSQNAEGDVVSFIWTAETGVNAYDLGAETYVLKDSLAQYQTFAAKVTPR